MQLNLDPAKNNSGRWYLVGPKLKIGGYSQEELRSDEKCPSVPVPVPTLIQRQKLVLTTPQKYPDSASLGAGTRGAVLLGRNGISIHGADASWSPSSYQTLSKISHYRLRRLEKRNGI